MIKYKGLSAILIIISIVVIWRLLQPTEIISIHANERRSNFNAIIRRPPLTDKGMMQWWQNNKVTLKEKYHVPLDERDYAINFWVADYQTDSGGDLLCFEDMPTSANCIDKENNPLTVWYRHDVHHMVFFLNNGKTKYYKNTQTGQIRQVN
ncbi:DUF943 family protein [Pantoea sp. B65]|uniref:DUF943 family protein n=1 Tax=Pantoea sp. B65 TaxID=2813359 RepID=UPI0039B3E9A4